MPCSPTRSAAEVQANTTFSALLWALSRPGIPQSLPYPGEGPAIDALLDRECRAYSADPTLLPELMRVGAEISEINAAHYVFLGKLHSLQLLEDIQTGSDLYPDKGALVLIRAQIGNGSELRLTGPGIDNDVILRINGLPDGFWQQRNALMRYPKGFDLILLDDANVTGVPRSTIVEVL